MSCPLCGFVESKRSDAHCGGCGTVLRRLTVAPEELIIYEPPGGTGEAPIRVDAVGISPVTARLETGEGLELQAPVESQNRLRSIRHGQDPLQLGLSLTKQFKPGSPIQCILTYEPAGRHVISVSVESAPLFRILPQSDALTLVASEDPDENTTVLELRENEEESDGQARKTYELQMRSTHVGGALRITSFKGEGDTPGCLLAAVGQAPWELPAGAGFRFAAEIPKGNAGEAQAVQFSLLIEADGLAPWRHSVVLRRKPLPRIELAKTDNWAGFMQRGVVRGIGSTYEARLPIVNHGPVPCRVTSMGCDAEFVEVLHRSDLVLPARTAGTPAKHQNVKLRLRPDAHDGAPGTVELRFTVSYVTDDERRESGDALLVTNIRFREAVDLPGALCVDFGTTNTCVAVPYDSNTWPEADEKEIMHVDADGQRIPVWISSIYVDDEERNRPGPFNYQEFPTMVKFLNHQQVEDGDWERGTRFGHSVRQTRSRGQLKDILATAAFFKSQLWQNHKLWPLDYQLTNLKEYSAEQLTELFFKGLVSFVQRTLGCKVAQLYLTHPAARVFDNEARTKLVEAAARGAGISSTRVRCCLTEPGAFAFWRLYELRKKLAEREHRIIGILDIGGGTTDITLLKAEKTQGDLVYKILYSGGLGLAGEEMTYQLTRFLIGEALRSRDLPQQLKEAYAAFRLPDSLGKAQHSMSGWGGEWRETFGTNWTNAERFKTATYSQSAEDDPPKPLEHTVFIRDPVEEKPVPVPLKLPRSAVDQVFKPMLDEMFGQLKTQLAELAVQGHIDGPTLDQLILAGNGSRLPLVQQMARAEFPGEGRVTQHGGRAKMGVVFGAALHYLYTTYGASQVREDKSTASALEYSIGVPHGFGFKTLLERGVDLTRAVSPTFPLFVTRFNPVLRLYEDSTPGNGNLASKHLLANIELDEMWDEPSDMTDKNVEINLVLKDRKLFARVKVVSNKSEGKPLVVECASFDGASWTPKTGTSRA